MKGMRQILIKDKKGGYLDIFIFMIVAFTLVLICGVFIYTNAQVNAQLKEVFIERDATGTSSINYTQVLDDTFTKLTPAYEALRWISFFLIIGMIIAVFIGSYLVTTKPVFFIPYIFIAFIAIVCAVEISNAYETLLNTPDLGATLQTFTGSNYILYNLPTWVAVIAIGGGIIMFVKMRHGEEYGYG